MELKQYKKRLDDEIIEPLIEKRNSDDDCGFNSRQVMEVRKLVIKYAKTLSKLKGKEEKVLKQMKKLIYAINKVNRKSDYCMLEGGKNDTESISYKLCYFIEDIAIDAGYPEITEDITERWREEW
jgi:hypothetical protein